MSRHTQELLMKDDCKGDDVDFIAKAHTTSLDPHSNLQSSNKENVEPPRLTTLRNKVKKFTRVSQAQSKELKKELKNVSQREKRIQTQLESVTYQHTEQAAIACQSNLLHEQEVSSNVELSARLQESEIAMKQCLERVTKLQKENHALKLRIARFSSQSNLICKDGNAIGPRFSLKEKGVVPDNVQALIRDLMAHGVTPEQVFPVIQLVTGASGVRLEGTVSGRTVTRIAIEGGVADDLMVIEAVKNARGITYSSDETTIRNITHESRTINTIDSGGNHRCFSLGVHSAVNHTADTQLTGLQLQVGDMFEIYNSSLEFGESPSDERIFPLKLNGINTEHASDQKKVARNMGDWKVTSDRSLTVAKAGCPTVWETLSGTERAQLHKEAYREICGELGEVEFQKLPPDEKVVAGLFVWAGCCMHKELNTVKGGCSEMDKYWESNRITSPVILPNKDAATVIAGGVDPAKNTGEQDSIRYTFEATFGFTLNFPDTSNTCYQSHCAAAAELVVHLNFYRKYLELIKDWKESRMSNHLEHNLLIALMDIPTISELCVLAVFLICISLRYMRIIRGEGSEELNVLEMGPTHQKSQALCLASDAKFEAATMNGRPWVRPEVMYAIWRLAPALPHLEELTIGFFAGALVTWRRFTTEYAPDDPISKISPDLRALAWMPTTNDVNEGALGSRRVIKRSIPKATELTLNAQQRYQWNKTGRFIRTLTHAKLQFICKRACHLQSLKLQKKLNIAKAEYDDALVKHKWAQDAIKLEKKRKAEEILSQVQPILDLSGFQSIALKMKNTELDLHRQFNSTLAKKTILRNKLLKEEELKRAIESLNARENRDSIVAEYCLKNSD
ncbi:hypothetical protein M422DRAFT_266547 [Sphaerobolus stellatus SS14]|uniref:Uncharacterized protein n=1 Tax=Sphaerobolus stellatus (strain SS14) TaxID=990650 RepID=A0A0C9URF2_SPHS4|nr:hypothetical protein M422DRAFT_266547 [Sphaerobolus stellatus SS14]